MTARHRPPSAGARAIALADGRGVVLRELTPRDAPALVAAVEAATPGDLRRRYLGTPPPASFLVERLRSADGVRHEHVGAFTADGTLVGAAQFDRSGTDPKAEIAVLVATEWQHDGLGTALLRYLADVARRRGVSRFTATFFADNLPLRRLLRDISDSVVTSCADGEGHAVLDLEPPVEGTTGRAAYSA